MIPILLIVVLVGAALIGLVIQRRFPPLRKLASGLLITYFTLILMFGAAEAYFRFFFAQSENTYSLATLNWLERYWRENSLGYRDREWTEADLQDKTTVVVTGDSFTAGWGIDNPADRYTDVLANLLGDDYAVINLGVYGTSTPEQLDLLKQNPVQNPDVVIMQYFLNDINYTMLSMGLLPTATPAPAWANESYFLNYLYNRVLSRYIDPSYNRDWWEDNYAAYDNATIWEAHRAEIEEYIDYVDSTDARLIVVIFPNMLDPVRSISYIDRVALEVESTGHNEILKLFDEAAAWTPSERMVSTRDTHPSPAFHHYVGELIYEQYFAEPQN